MTPPNPKTLREEVEYLVSILQKQARVMNIFDDASPIITTRRQMREEIEHRADSLQAILDRTGG